MSLSVSRILVIMASLSLFPNARIVISIVPCDYALLKHAIFSANGVEVLAEALWQRTKAQSILKKIVPE